MPWPQGFINQNRYLVHTGQLQSFTIDADGQTNASSITTVSCYVYHENDTENQAVPLSTTRIKHMALIPSSVTVEEGYHLTAVDSYGSTVISQAQVTYVQDYNSHLFGNRIKLLYLEMPAI